LTTLVIVALLGWVVLAIVAIHVDQSYIDVIHRALTRGVSYTEAHSANKRQGNLGLAECAWFVATAVVFIAWFHRAYTNLARLGITQLRWSTGWAVGAWFVPFLNVARPKSIANDIWRGSNPDLPATCALPTGRVPWFHTAWWAVLLAGGIVGRILLQRADHANTPADLDSYASIVQLNDVLILVAAVLGTAVVQQTANRQESRAHALAGSPPAARRPTYEPTDKRIECRSCGFPNSPIFAECSQCGSSLRATHLSAGALDR